MMQPWQFWFDVGGTFTDCVAISPAGAATRLKVLSSGVTLGAAGAGSSPSAVRDAARGGEPAEFWRDYRLRLFDDRGAPLAERRVIAFDSAQGELILDAALPAAPAVGQRYELAGGEEAPILAIRRALGLPRNVPLPPVVARLGATRGTNALLTRRGARVALVITRGFGDILRIGYQNRPRLFDLNIRQPTPLFEMVVEVDERVTHQGEVLRPLDPARASAQLAEARAGGARSLAICLLHGSAHPAHESLLEQAARDVGFAEISVSHKVAPLVKIVARGDTTVVDAYLNPVLRTYLAALAEALGEHSSLRLLTSAGGLTRAADFHGKDSILSGPAGGVVGFARVAQSAGFGRAIGFDMGGTSTDVSRHDGRLEVEFETEKAGVRVCAPTLAIETVAAGGGSLCRFDGVKLVVGPDSAGADPGPACYGRGGPLAITDANLFLGKILPAHFPFPLDGAAVRRRLRALADEIEAAVGRRPALESLAEGCVRVANARMAQAIRAISVAKGYDPREYPLVPFGAAGGQHACAVAAELGMTRVLSHPDAGVLSALGIGLADVTRHKVRGVYQPLTDAWLAASPTLFQSLEDEARREVLAEGVPAQRVTARRALDLRYAGLDAPLAIAEPPDGDYARAYADAHQRLYGHHAPGRALEVVAARVEAVGVSGSALPSLARAASRGPATPIGQTRLYFAGRWQAAPVYARDKLRPGDALAGPAVVVEALATTIIDPGWRAEALAGGATATLLLTAAETGAPDEHAGPVASSSRPEGDDAADPVELEIFNNHFAAIAEQMGITLRNTSTSVNVKERLDFSCALFTANGDLVVNAPHIPVHLGAMAETVKRVLADNPNPQPGDVFATNDPYRGGSHLPDVTVVTPVRDPASGALVFFTASRAHHAEIGGVTPGSMPPFSKNLAEEGVLIRDFKLIDGGQPRFDALRRLLLSAPHPTRAVDDNLADAAAQVAANQQGARDLLALCSRFTTPVVLEYMRRVQAAAERKTRQALARLPDGRRAFVDWLDDGSPIQVAITKTGSNAVFDFAGTGPVLPGNLNANRAIVTAAVMYCLRCLLDEDIPLNQGVLAPVEIRLPECLLCPTERPAAEDCPAVVGGNVETSQRVVDVILGALGLAAASQGTMNNTLFGDGSFGYYETICGGAGATPQAAGADAVHTHMTNTRLTDPEVLERRFPARVLEFSIRRGSGGAGARRGGDGVRRVLEFLRPLQLSVLATRRGRFAPYGLEGGAPGAVGRATLIRANGEQQALASQAQVEVGPGDRLVIETPGGGGHGA